eukprot:6122588-Amphidinium_carterae.1
MEALVLNPVDGRRKKVRLCLEYVHCAVRAVASQRRAWAQIGKDSIQNNLGYLCLFRVGILSVTGATATGPVVVPAFNTTSKNI